MDPHLDSPATPDRPRRWLLLRFFVLALAGASWSLVAIGPCPSGKSGLWVGFHSLLLIGSLATGAATLIAAGVRWVTGRCHH